MSGAARSVLVIGDGVAGTAAAWRAAEAGAAVTVVSAGAGASVLASGAVDEVPWEQVVAAARIAGAEPRARALGAEVGAFVEALDLWRVPAAGEAFALLATLAGRARAARGHDRALLDLAGIGGGVVAVPRAPRAGWDADSLAACWNAEPAVRRLGLSFAAIDAALLRFDGEHRLPDLDLAARHDDPVRLRWLAERLREAIGRTALHPAAVILGPWLGAEAPQAAALEEALGLRAGEALVGVGSPAGLRFAKARDRLFGRCGVRVIGGRVRDVRLDDDGEGRPSAAIEGEEGRRWFDRVIAACGGLTGGGIVYEPLDMRAGADMPEEYNPVFRLSFTLEAGDGGAGPQSAPVSRRRAELSELPRFAAGGAQIGIPGSMFGPELGHSAWPSPGRAGALESIGLDCDAEGAARLRFAAAGDVVADLPRTVLAAVQSGLRAGSG